MIIQFKSLKLRNFLSFGNAYTDVDLTLPGSTLIQGENLDNGGANGAGKTTIINALCYSLYNKPFDNISLQRLINATNNSKNTLMEVRLVFQKGEDEYEIYRCRGESYNIQLFMNGKEITLDSVSENDKLVEEIIGISYDLFTKVIIFSGNSIPFLQMPLAQQRSQIEELFNITMLTEKAIKLKELIKATESNIVVQEAVLKEQESQVTLFNKQLKDAETRVLRWENDREAQLKSINDQIDKLSSVDINQEKEIHLSLEALLKEESEIISHKNILTKDKNILSSDITKITNELNHLLGDKCPYCLQQYAGAGDKLKEKKESLELKKNNLDDTLQSLTLLNDRLEEIVGFKNKIKGETKFASFADAVKAESNALTAMQKIQELQNSINPHIEAFEQLSHQAIKKVDYSVLDVAKRDLEHQQFLLKLLTDKNSFIRKKIIQKTVPFLNNRLMFYTKELGLPHVISFDNDMSCSVTEYGRELDFGNLSSGEKKRVNLSLSLAFRDVLHQLHAKFNCIFIDEIDASLDSAGVENVFKLMKNKSRDDDLAMWIISHRPEAVGRFDRNVIIRKENGFSRILTEE